MSALDRTDIDALAGEYVLGLLDPDEMGHVETRAVSETALRDAIAYYRDRFIALDDTAGVAPIPPDLWQRIAAGLDAPVTVPAALAQSGAGAGLFSRLWSSLGFWRPVGLGFALATLMLAALVSLDLATVREVGRPVAVAVLLDDDQRPGAIVEVYADDDIRVVPLTDVAVPADRTLQVWTLPDEDTGPVSVGLLETVTTGFLPAPDVPLAGENQLYEITLEPAGGSPTGLPTGPILFIGYADAPR